MPGRRNRRGPPEAADYRHADKKRKNNPPAGLVAETVEPPRTVKYAYDPHLDPQLIWTGKAERASFEVDTVSLQVNERISTKAILRAVERKDIERGLFEDPDLTAAGAVEFYQHDVGWANRLILGDSLLVMNSLLEREGMRGQIQMIYVDPPYGVQYQSNFQPTVRKREVKDGKDEDLTREPEQIKAYRDTWTLGIHSYLTYLRDRLLLSKELLHETGSIFVQISDENVHRVRLLMDEVFGAHNFCSVVSFVKTSGASSPWAYVNVLATTTDFLLWYAKDRERVKYRQLYWEKEFGGRGATPYSRVELGDGSRRPLTSEERQDPSHVPGGGRIYSLDNLASQGFSESMTVDFEFKGKTYHPGSGNHWKTTVEGLRRLVAASRIEATESRIGYVRYIDDFPVYPMTASWPDTASSFMEQKMYVVQTTPKVVGRCVLMTTDPGELVLDPTCGSGTTAFVAEQWGRRWITCDTSRVALAIARQRVLTARFAYYRLQDPRRGVGTGFVYETVPHVTLKSIAQNKRIDEVPEDEPRRREKIERLIRESEEKETLCDRPEIERDKVRVSGPFTVEGLAEYSLEDEELWESVEASARCDDVARSRVVRKATGDHVADLVGIMRKGGIQIPGRRRLIFERLSTAGGGGFVHAEGEARAEGTKEGTPALGVAVSFGPKYGQVTSRHVERATVEAGREFDLVIVVAFAFDPEAHAYLEKRAAKKPELILAAAQPDILIGDLLKKPRQSALIASFGRPEVEARREKEGWLVRLLGADFYDPIAGRVTAVRDEEIAAWLLDHDYDGRTFCVCQAFFPGGGSNAWEKLANALRGTVDPAAFETLRSTESRPFQAGEHRRAAVKAIDLRGNEAIRIVPLEERR